MKNVSGPGIFLSGLLILWLWGLLIYSNTFQCPFVFDDLPFIVHNKNIKDLGDIPAIWNASLSHSRFISFLSFAVNYRFHGLDVSGYHAVNLIIHLINAGLVAWLMLLTLSTEKLRKSAFAQNRKLISFCVAILFLAHPAQTEAVTYITQRFASLATMFYLSSLCFYAYARSRCKNIFYGAAALTAIAAMFTKEIALTLPLMVILYDGFFLKKEGKGFPLYWLVILLLLLIIPAFYSFKISNVLSGQALSGSFLGEPVDRNSYFLTQFRVVLTYIRLLFFPVHQNLLYEYPASKSLLEVPTLLSLVVLVGILIFAFLMRRKNILLAFGIFWFFIGLSVESSVIVIRHVIFEHRVYLPSVGFFMAFVAGIFGLFKNKNGVGAVREPPLRIGIIIILVMVYSYLTYERNKVWADAISLWGDVVAKSPRLIKAQLNLGAAYAQDKQYMEAIKVYTKMIEQAPNAEAFGNRGNVYNSMGAYDMAIADYDKAIAIKPRSAQMHTNRGDARFNKKEYQKAIDDYTKAIELNPEYFHAYSNRASVYRVQEKYVLAQKDFNEAIKRNPYFIEPYMGIGVIAFSQGDFVKAVDYFSQVLNLEPANVSALINRGSSYSGLKQFDPALNDYQKALTLEPTNGQVYYNRGIVFRKMGKEDKAQEDFEKAKALGYEVKDIR
ncbi:MAG TPA: tetratricopeptide repeat protein [Candidatus Omnitrophota bacterium]|nr:tetratricopeptide repeat protein [Candidatus Omnitrophota bacterium]